MSMPSTIAASRAFASGTKSTCLPRRRASSATGRTPRTDRKSTRLNSSHLVISYAVFCLKKKKEYDQDPLVDRLLLALPIGAAVSRLAAHYTDLGLLAIQSAAFPLPRSSAHVAYPRCAAAR